MAVVKSPKNHRKKLFWKYKYKTSKRKQLETQKKIHLLIRNYSVKEQNIRINNYNSKIKHYSSYLYDIKTHYNDPRFLVWTYPHGKELIIITEKLTFHKNFNKKLLTTRRLNTIYTRQFRKIIKLYIAFIKHNLKIMVESTTTITDEILQLENIEDIPLAEYSILHQKWIEFLQTPNFISYIEDNTDYTLAYDIEDKVLLVDGHPVFIRKGIYEYMKEKWWTKKEIIKEETSNPEIPVDKTLDIPKKKIIYKKHSKTKYYKKYNKTWRYKKFKKRYLQRINTYVTLSLNSIDTDNF